MVSGAFGVALTLGSRVLVSYVSRSVSVISESGLVLCGVGASRFGEGGA